MKLRELQADDIEVVEQIIDLYWTKSDPFRQSLSKKLSAVATGSTEYEKQDLHFYVTEEESELLGIAGFRKCPEHMQKFAKTDRPAELYVLAVKEKNRGIGKALYEKRLKEMRDLGYTEALMFSSESHKDSWGFHNKMSTELVGPAVAPDGELGQVWRVVIE